MLHRILAAAALAALPGLAFDSLITPLNNQPPDGAQNLPRQGGKKPMRIITCMTAAALFCASATPMASASEETVPILSGAYVFQKVENCGGGVMVQITGTWTFNNTAKTYSAKGYSISGVPLAIKSVSGNGTFTNSATEVIFDGNSPYYAFYGAVTGGVASKVVLIALGSGPCGEQFIMSH